MTRTYIVDLKHNDDLEKVIQKCNRNFKLITGQVSKQAKISQRVNNGDIEDAVSEALAEVVQDLTSDIETEASARRNGDQNLQDQIDTIASSGGSGTSNYNDLINKPSIEGVTLEGDKTYEELNLSRITNTEIENMLT